MINWYGFLYACLICATWCALDDALYKNRSAKWIFAIWFLGMVWPVIWGYYLLLLIIRVGRLSK